MEPIKFWAIVYKVQTLAGDNGIRVTLDLPEDAIVQAAELMVCKREEVVLDIECVEQGGRLDGKQTDARA